MWHQRDDKDEKIKDKTYGALFIFLIIEDVYDENSLFESFFSSNCCESDKKILLEKLFGVTQKLLRQATSDLLDSILMHPPVDD